MTHQLEESLARLERSKSSVGCPAALLDPWFAYLTPWFDYAVSDAAWSNMVARYGNVVRKLMSLPSELRVRLDYGARAIIVREAMRHTQEARSLVVCETVAQLCEAVAAGQPIDEKAFDAAAAQAAQAAPWVAAAAQAAGERAAVRAARAAAERAAWGRAAPLVAAQAAVDRITTAIFDLIETS
jgi:hypothetical protein